jgi:adenylate kinase
MPGRKLAVIDVAVPADEIVRRLASRRVCASCAAIADPKAGGSVCAKCGGPLIQRADDREDVVRERLRVYEKNTKPLLDYYRGRPSFKEIDGTKMPDQVAVAVAAAVAEVAGTKQ